jgi:UDP-N-acetylglucosamine 4,6-dehydratase
MYKDKVLLITGGTGSFGETMLQHFLGTNISEIRIFSRDEKKQEDLRLKYRNPRLNFIVGDVRDYKSIKNALVGVDYLFQAAALKQVHTCEFYPMQAINTNILGSENVLEAAIESKVQRTVVLSTDKAVYPINTMGMTKALMEKLTISKARDVRAQDAKLKMAITRYGNVMCSRGSVIPLFIEQIKSGKDITVTVPGMTRFLMSLEESVSLVLKAFECADSGDIFVQKAPACTVETLANSLIEIFSAKAQVRIMGARHGEKLFESLCSREEMQKARDIGDYYQVPPDLRDMNYSKYSDTTTQKDLARDEYNSNNTKQLSVAETIDILLKQPYVQEQLRS